MQNSHKQTPDPYQVFNDFFERYELHDCQLELWRLLGAAFSSEDADNWNRLDRGNAIFFCKNIDEVLKALYALREKFKNEPPG
ncbi:MAG TPA: hypothetical protein VD996_15315 [Chitinophagaceae bacterium]|nr:hypothetical protein [Chitinophagaceae bacterium]